MLKLPKIKLIYLIILGVILLGVNYFFFQKSLQKNFTVEATNKTVAAILKENGIGVESVPAIYNIKDKEDINFLSNDSIRNQAQEYDQIVYYKPENILVLYRPQTKSIISATTLVK